jgi:hypothetical protein
MGSHALFFKTVIYSTIDTSIIWIGRIQYNIKISVYKTYITVGLY